MNQRDTAVRAIFTHAVEIDDEQQRSEYLAQACGADTQLRRHVEDLIQANADAGAFLGGAGNAAEPAVPNTPAGTLLVTPITEKPGDTIGPYKLLQQIGEGGCGVVYMAEQEQPVRRKVALKVIKLGMDTKSVIARFEAERQALALMEHPNIARVLDAGATNTGRPYFVMELVRGLKITEHCDQYKLPTAERLNLFIQVCQAIQHAHQKGIIHRDIKPSNILVTLHDGVPVPKVIDFGIAKATQGKLTDQTLFTAVEQFLGTPAYMSPEQADRGESDIDTRSDIYALGVLLYELLTGQTPFDTRELMAAGPDTMRRTIRDREPPLPSTCLSTMVDEELGTTAQRRQTEPLKLIYLVRGDLDWIVLKCLEKDRTRRYDTAKGLANDILRHLNNEAVLARPPSAGYRFQKLLTRNKAAFGAVCAVTLALILGLVASLWLYFKERVALQNERTARGLARDESRRAEAAASEVKMTLSASDFSHAVLLAEQGNGIDALAYLTRSLTLNPTNHAASTLLGTLLIYRSWMPPRVVIRQTGFMRAAQFSPDGKCIVTASDGGVARVWDAETGQPLGQPMQHGGSVRLAQFSPNGKRVVTACFDGTARVWDALTGRPVTDWLKHTMGIVYAEFSSDGKRVVTASDDGSARVWDAESGHPLTGPLNHGYLHLIRTARFSPDGRWVVSASKDGTVRVWDAAAGQELFAPLHATSGNGALFSPDGKQVVTTGDDGAQVWDAHTGQPLTPLLEHGGAVWVAQFSPDGQLLVTGADDGTARVWNAHTGQPVTTRLRHAGPVRSVEFSADAQQVLTGSFDGTVRLWDSNNGEPLAEPLKHGGWVRSARFSPDGQRVVTASDDGTARVWGPRTGQSLSMPFAHRGAVLRAEFNLEGTRILTASGDGTARVWDSQTGKPITQPMQHSNAVLCAQFSLDGNRVVTASSDGTARVWDAQTGRPFTEPMKHADAVLWAQFSPDASRVVTACADHSARVWDAHTGRPLTPRLQHEGSVFWAQFSPDGQRLVTTADDSTALLWDAQTGQVSAEPLKHSGWVQSAQFSPDGMRVVTASLHARVWDAQNGRPLTEPLKHAAKVWSARFSPDGTRVVTASEDGSARVWDSQTGRALTPPMRHQAPVKSAEFSPNGKRIVTASLDGSARLWDATSGLLLADPWKHARAVRYAQFRVCDRRVVTASDDGTAAIWDISPSEAPVPHWMLLLAETLSDQVVTKEGVLDQLKVDQVGTLAPILDELNRAPADDPWAELGRWFLTNPLTRTISPYSKVLVADYIEDRLKEDTLESLQLAGQAANGSVELQRRIHSARAALEQHKPLERSESQPPSGAPHL